MAVQNNLITSWRDSNGNACVATGTGQGWSSTVSLGQACSTEPVVTPFNGSYYVAYLSGSSVMVSSSPRSATGTKPLGSWSQPITAGSSAAGGKSPAVAVLGNKLFVVYVTSSNNALSCSSSIDGITWSGAAVGTTGLGSPSLAAYGGKLWLAFKDGSGNIFAWSSADGVTWSAGPAVNQSCQGSPGLGVWGGKLWLVFRANNTSNSILLCSFDGSAWSGNSKVNQTTTGSPAITGLDGTLWVSFTDGSGNLCYVTSTDGVTWSGSSSTGLSTSPSPALATTGIPQGMLLDPQFTKVYADTAYTYTASVIHQGNVIAFAMDASANLYYSVLYFDDPTILSAQVDAAYWSTLDPGRNHPIALAFPSEVRREGVGSFGQLALQATSNPDGTINQPSTAQLTANAPFQVLSDGTHIYLFRQSKMDGDVVSNTSTGVNYKFAHKALLVDRFALSGGSLSLVPEVRFQRSRSRDFPASNKDSLSPTDMNGNPFIEPTHELATVQCFKSFTVSLLPTQVAGTWRWQIFSLHTSGWVDSFSILQAEDGLFDFAGPLSFACPNSDHVYVQPLPGTCSRSCGKQLSQNKSGAYYCPVHLSYTSTSAGYCPQVCGLTYAQVPSAETADACLALGNQAMADLGSFALAGSGGKFTIELWCQLTQLTACTLLFQSVSGVELDFDATGALVCGGLNTSQQNSDLGWHHYALVYDGAHRALYKDGILCAADSTSVTIPPGAANVYLGSRTTAQGPTAPVNVDELRFWGVALSQAEIQTNLRSRVIGNEKALQHYFRFDEAGGTTVHDSAGSATGTVYNPAKSTIWVPSDAPLGQAGGIRYERFFVSGITGNLSAQVYHQQELLPSPAGGVSKLQATAARLMLVFDAGGHASALDFAIGADGQLAQAPDALTVPALNKGTVLQPVSMDGRGLTVYGGTLDFTGNTLDAAAVTSPTLYSSVNGSLSLYWNGALRQLTSASYSPIVTRTVVKIQGGGALYFVAKTAGADFNDLAVTITQPSGATTLTVTVSHGSYTETWTGVSADAQTLAATLNAQPLPADASGAPQSYRYTDSSTAAAQVTANRADADLGAGSLLVAVAVEPLSTDTTFTVAPTSGPVTCASTGGTSGSSASWQATAPASAISLNGAPLRLATLGEGALPPSPTWDLTLEAWVNPAGLDPTKGCQYLICQTGGAELNGYYLMLAGGYGVQAGVTKSTVTVSAMTGAGLIPANQWSHVAAVFHQKAAVRLDGLAGYLDCGNDSSIGLTSDLTIEAWVQLTASAGSGTVGIVSKGLLGDGTNGTVSRVPYALYIDKGTLVFAYSRSDGKMAFAVGPSFPTDGMPHAIAVTRKCNQSWTDPDSGYRTLFWDQIKFYVDGSLKGTLKVFTADYVSDSSDTSIADDGGNLVIGRVGGRGVNLKAATDAYNAAKGASGNASIYGSAAKSNLSFSGTAGLASPVSLDTPIATLPALLTEVRLWSAVLADDETCQPMAASASGLAARWRFEERRDIQSADDVGPNTAMFMNGVSWDQSRDNGPSSSAWTLYVNGAPVASSRFLDSVTPGDAPQLYLGGCASLPQNNPPPSVWAYTGLLTEVRIWGMERTATQVLENMHRTIDRDVSNNGYLDNPGSLLAYYTLDSVGSTRLLDRANPNGGGADLVLYSPFHFDGNTFFPAPSGVDLTGSFTVELWYKRDVLGVDNCILSQGSGASPSTDKTLGIGFTSPTTGTNRVSFGFYDDDLHVTIADTVSVWHHLAFVYDRARGAHGTRTIYLDGRQIGTDLPTGFYAGGAGQVLLGRSAFGSTFARGNISELRIWTVARQASDIVADMYCLLTGKENNLAALYPFDGNPNWVGHGALYPKLTGQASTAPLGAELPEAWSGLGAATLSGCAALSASPLGVSEYGVIETDAAGAMNGALKRCYSVIQNGQWLLSNGFKLGALLVEWVGQVQFAPQLLGYIEGAPPVPGENMTQSGVDYRGQSSVQLNIADQVQYTYSAQRDKGFDYEIESSFQLGLDDEEGVGLGVNKQVVLAKFLIGGQSKTEGGISKQDSVEPTVGISQAQLSEMDLDGYYYDAGDGLGARFVPRNEGYALVKSGVADQYAMRLATTGAVIGYQMVVNPKIPPDWNIITFPLNPYYIRQGCLDGRFGRLNPDGTTQLVNDPHFPAAGGPGDASYFRATEAYALKSKIIREEQKLATQYAHYDAVGIGNKSWVDLHRSQGKLSSVSKLTMEDDLRTLIQSPDVESSGDSGDGDQEPAQLVKRSMWNTYLWTAYGGLFSETEQTVDGYTETLGGTYNYKTVAGLKVDANFSIMDVASEFALSALFGGHVNVSISKSASATTNFGVSVNVGLDRTLCRPDSSGAVKTNASQYDTVFVNGNLKQLQVPVTTGGLVDAYRFMTFYLAPEQNNNTEFWSRVVNTQWLDLDSGPNAAALRQVRDGQGGKAPPCWRVLHRVTFVSRLKPDKFQPVTPESPVIALDAGSHYLLIKQLEPYVRGATKDWPTLRDTVMSALQTCYGQDFPALLQPQTAMQVAQLVAEYYGVPVPQ